MKNINEEVNKIKRLFNFKKGDVITESIINEQLSDVNKDEDEEVVDLDDDGVFDYEKVISHKYNITLQFNTIVVNNETGEEEYGEIIEELLDIPDSYEEGLKIFQQKLDKLGGKN